MSWSYTFHRFETRAAFEAALTALAWDEGVPAHAVALDVLGVLYRTGERVGTDPETGEPVHERIALDGWHVNAAWQGLEMPEVFALAEIPAPNHPARIFAGADLVAAILLDEAAPVTGPADPA